MAESVERHQEEGVTDEPNGNPAIPPEDDIKAMNIHQRMHGVRCLVGGNVKKAHMAEVETKKGGRYTYDYVSHDDATEHVRAALNIFRINTLPTQASRTDNTNRTELEVDVIFVNIDQPEDRVTLRFPGYGADYSDKGPGKAFSYAMKIAYLKTFQLNSADDIEEYDIKHDPAETRESKTEAERVVASESMRAWAEEVKAELARATSHAEVKAIQKRTKPMLAAESAVPEVTRLYFVELITKRLADFEEPIKD